VFNSNTSMMTNTFLLLGGPALLRDSRFEVICIQWHIEHASNRDDLPILILTQTHLGVCIDISTAGQHLMRFCMIEWDLTMNTSISIVKWKLTSPPKHVFNFHTDTNTYTTSTIHGWDQETAYRKQQHSCWLQQDIPYGHYCNTNHNITGLCVNIRVLVE